MSLFRATWPLLALLSCVGEGPIAEQESPVMEAVASAWRQGPDHLDAVILELNEPDRWLAVRSLLEKYPESSSTPICRVLTGQASSLCQQQKDELKNRPHLWADSDQVKGQAKRKALDEKKRLQPRSSRLRVPVDLTATLLSLGQRKVDCSPKDPQCRLKAALLALEKEGVEAAAQTCRQPSQIWQSECFFRLGEAQAQRTWVEGNKATLAQNIELCQASGQFAAECMEHSVVLYSHVAPSADDPRQDAWRGFQENAQGLVQSLGARDPELLDSLLQRFWSGIFEQAFRRARQITGDLFDRFPAAMAPQIRAGAALYWVRDKKAEGHEWGSSLEALEQEGRALGLSLESRALETRASTPPRAKDISSKRLRDFWPVDHGGDEGFPAIAYLGAFRRTWSETAAIDLQICLLEALAQNGVGEALLEAAQASEHAAIAWTAERLSTRR